MTEAEYDLMLKQAQEELAKNPELHRRLEKCVKKCREEAERRRRRLMRRRPWVWPWCKPIVFLGRTNAL